MTPQHDAGAIDVVVAAHGFDRLVHIGFALKAVGVFAESPHGMEFDIRISGDCRNAGVSTIGAFEEKQLTDSRRWGASMKHHVEPRRFRWVVFLWNYQT